MKALNKKKNIKSINIATKPTYVDLFCGAGGLSLGFDMAGFKNIFSLDNNKTFCKTYKKNFPKHLLIEKDISDLKKEEIKKILKNKKVDIVIGGPPCQGFSMAGNIGRMFIDDPRNHLFKEFSRIVDIIKPTFFIMENVARLYTHSGGKTKKDIILTFNKMGYHVDCKILNSANHEIPQVRRRVIFIGSKKNNKLFFPKETNKYITVKDALDDLPILKSGEKSAIPNHVAMKHSEQMLSKMKYVTDGGDRQEIPYKLRPKTGDVRKYIRYKSSKPAVTITGDMRKVFHYSQNRALTVRELARLQSFPDGFIFEGNSISQQQQVGNSVPPLLAEAIAKAVKKMINN